MKLRLFTTTLIITLFISCSPFQSKDLKDFNLKGKIKEITNIKFIAIEKFGIIEKGKKAERIDEDFTENSTIKFDINGIAYESSLFDKKGNLDYRIIRTDTVFDFFNSNGNLMIKGITNDIDFPTESSLHNSEGELLSKISSTYDKEMNLIDEKTYNEKGELIKHSKCEFNNKNQLKEEVLLEKTKVSFYWDDNEYKEETTTTRYSYNKNGEVSEKLVNNNDNSETIRYKYKYDKNNNWVERTQFDEIKSKYILERKIQYNK